MNMGLVGSEAGQGGHADSVGELHGSDLERGEEGSSRHGPSLESWFMTAANE